jgi:hypothetical protein
LYCRGQLADRNASPCRLSTSSGCGLEDVPYALTHGRTPIWTLEMQTQANAARRNVATSCRVLFRKLPALTVLLSLTYMGSTVRYGTFEKAPSDGAAPFVPCLNLGSPSSHDPRGRMSHERGGPKNGRAIQSIEQSECGPQIRATTNTENPSESATAPISRSLDRMAMPRACSRPSVLTASRRRPLMSGYLLDSKLVGLVEAAGVEPDHCIDSTELVDFRNGRKSKNDMISKSAVQTLYKNLTDCHECHRGFSRRIPALTATQKRCALAHLQIIFGPASRC